MSAIQVLIVTESLEIWGAERTLLELARNVDRTRFELSFLVAEASPLAQVVRDLGFQAETHRFARHRALEATGGLSGAGPTTLLNEAFSIGLGALRLISLFRKFDLILSFSLWQAFESVLAAKLARRAFVLDIHETFGGSKGHLVLRQLVRMSAGVVAPSRSVLARSGLMPNSRLIVVPRPVASPASVPLGNRSDFAPGKQITVGVFGQISSHKGVLRVVEAVVKVRSDCVSLLIVGGRPLASRSLYEEQVRAAATALGSGSMVVDTVPQVFDLMSTCNFVVNASDHEAFGRGVIEAIASGAVPVAIGDGGPSEIVSDSGIGVVLESAEALTDYLSAITDGAIAYPIFSPESREAALRSYRPDMVAGLYFDNLAAVVERNRTAK